MGFCGSVAWQGALFSLGIKPGGSGSADSAGRRPGTALGASRLMRMPVRPALPGHQARAAVVAWFCYQSVMALLKCGHSPLTPWAAGPLVD
jgi:hypothetical protein